MKILPQYSEIENSINEFNEYIQKLNTHLLFEPQRIENITNKVNAIKSTMNGRLHGWWKMGYRINIKYIEILSERGRKVVIETYQYGLRKLKEIAYENIIS